MFPSDRRQLQPTIRVLVLGLVLLCVPRASAPQEIPKRAVVVEAVDDGLAAHQAGILPGDAFTSWELAASGSAPAVNGELSSPFDLDDVENEYGPRGLVTLRGLRGEQRLAIAAPQGRWRLHARPSLTPRSLEAYSRGRDLAAKGRVDEAVDAWRAAVGTADDDAASAWLLMQAGIALGDARKFDDAHRVTRDALTAAERAANRAAIAGVHQAQARIYERQNDLGKAEAVYGAIVDTRRGTGTPGLGYAKALGDLASLRVNRENLAGAEPLLLEAVEIQRRLAPESIALARSLSSLGNVMRARNNAKGAAPMLREGADMLERIAPDTVDFAVSLNNIGTSLWPRGPLDQAVTQYRRALGILERVEPSGPAIAASLMGLASVSLLQGRLTEAESYFRRALALQERLAPGTGSEARVLNNLGILMFNRGALVQAEELYARALVIHERVAPGSLAVAQTLHNIGLVHRQRGDSVRAEDYLSRALELKERWEPEGVGSANTLEALGNLASERGDYDAADSLLQRTLVLKERQGPRSSAVAVTLNNLGQLALGRGDLESARQRFETARVLLEQTAPDSLEMSNVLDRLAAVAERQGKIDDAEALATRAAALSAQLAPDSATHAFILRRLGRLARDRGDLETAAASFAASLDAVESQSTRLGGSNEVRTAYAGQRRAIYLEYVDVLVRLGQPARAFEALERSRARALLRMLAERDIVPDADLSPDLKQTTRALREEYRPPAGSAHQAQSPAEWRPDRPTPARPARSAREAKPGRRQRSRGVAPACRTAVFAGARPGPGATGARPRHRDAVVSDRRRRVPSLRCPAIDRR